ncbi:hypothetical protein ACHAPZ_007597 [Fusarium culmorum]
MYSRSRPPGGLTKKRKTEGELSANPHTKRVRARNEGLSEEHRAYEKARKNFNQQWKCLKDKLHARADFKNADSATKKSLEEAAFDEHSENKLLGRHPDQLLPDESSQSQSQVNQVDEDDGNSDWETDDELDEDEQEELDRICESLNYGESTEQMKVKSQDEIAARRVMGDFSVTTKYVRKTLKEALESLWTKCHYLRNRAKWSADEIAMFRDI